MNFTEKKSKFFLSLFALVAIISIIVTYYKYIIVKDIEYYTNEEAFNESLLEK